MALQDQWNAAFGPNATAGLRLPGLETLGPAAAFEERCIMAAIAAALAIASEAVNTPNHANRVALARAVTNKPMDWMAPFAAALASQGLDSSSNDAAISNEMGAIWNCLAGAL